jgi:hypothetical protein
MKFELVAFNRNATDDELLQDLVAVGAQLKASGKRLTYRSYGDIGKYSAGTLQVRFGSWNDALTKAGLSLSMERDIPLHALFDNLKIVWITKGKQPVSRDMGTPPSQYRASTYSVRFGSWRKALEEFVAAVDQEQYNIISEEAEIKKNKSLKITKRNPSLSLRFLVLKRDNFCCASCGRSPATLVGLVLEIDHIFPWSEGGETIEENLLTLCFDCNRGKAARY